MNLKSENETLRMVFFFFFCMTPNSIQELSEASKGVGSTASDDLWQRKFDDLKTEKEKKENGFKKEIDDLLKLIQDKQTVERKQVCIFIFKSLLFLYSFHSLISLILRIFTFQIEEMKASYTIELENALHKLREKDSQITDLQCEISAK